MAADKARCIEIEEQLFARFAALRTIGEWFKDDPSIHEAFMRGGRDAPR